MTDTPTVEQLKAVVEDVKKCQAHSHQVAGMALAIVAALKGMVGASIDLDDEWKRVAGQARQLGSEPPIGAHLRGDVLVVKLAADALAAHRARLSPRAARLLTELQRLGDEAGA